MKAAARHCRVLPLTRCELNLAAVALSALPVWRRVDPLAILALSDEERRKREEELRAARETEDQSEEAVGRLLDDEEPRAR